MMAFDNSRYEKHLTECTYEQLLKEKFAIYQQIGTILSLLEYESYLEAGGEELDDKLRLIKEAIQKKGKGGL